MNNFALRRRQIDFHAYVTTSPVLVIREHYFSKGKGLTRHAVYFTELFARENYFEILRANTNEIWDNDEKAYKISTLQAEEFIIAFVHPNPMLFYN